MTELKKLQQVNKAAAQAKLDLEILTDMAADHGVPTWFVGRLIGITENIKVVGIKNAR